MGTSYDIRCIDCNENADAGAPWDPIHISDLQPLKQAIEAIKNISPPSGDIALATDVNVRISLTWAIKHAGHRIRFVSQYGEVEGTCAKEFRCTHCGSHKGYCDKDADHPDECGKRDAKTSPTA